MAIATYPAVASPVKSVQRGSAAGAGTVTISAIDISKAMVNVFGTTSSGTVSASFGMSMNSGSVTMPVVGGMERANFGTYRFSAAGASTISGITANGDINNAPHANVSATVNAGNAVVNAGSNNLVAAVVQGYLSNSTSLVVSGACRWEVVEFN
jgi:hypothetical protein